jgi:outer membrane protein assembly factor BamB
MAVLATAAALTPQAHGAGDYRRVTMTLSGMATSGDDAVLNLHVRGDRSTGGWATIRGEFCEVRQPDFRITDGRLRGRAVLVHAGTTYELRVDAAGANGQLTGTFDVSSGAVGIQPSSAGDVTGHLERHYDPKRPARISMEFPSSYSEVVFRNPRVEFTWADGKAADTLFVSARGPVGEAGRGFSGRIDEVEISLDAEGLAGTAVATVTDGGATKGRYRFAFRAHERANLLAGTVKMQHEGKDIGGGALTGAAVPTGERADPEEALWVLDLADGLGNGSPLGLRLKRSAGKFLDAYGGNGAHEADASGLKFSGGRLTGRVKVVFLPTGSYPPHGKRLRAAMDISATVRDGKIIGLHKAMFDVQGATTGKASGRIFSEADLPKGDFGAGKAPWPCWRGPYGNGTAVETGVELVDDLRKARLVWESEDYVPHSSPRGSPTGGHWSGEYASPILAEGRIYLAYWRPPGRDHHRYTEADLKHQYYRGRNPVKGRTDLTADDIVHCFDMQTGRTLWRKVLAGRGKIIAGYKQGAHLTMCYGDGKVFAPGVGGQLYGLDAATGRLLWEQPGACHLHTAPAYIDGVVAVHNRDLRGYDAATGKLLWRGPTGGHNASPITWRHKGKGYFLRSGALVEARTGKVCWQIPRPDGATAEAIEGNILVMPYRGEGGQKRSREDPAANGMTAFHISPAKYEKLWQLPMPNRHGSQFPPGFIYRGHAYGHIDRLPGPGTTKRGRFLACVELTTGKIVAAMAEQAALGYSPIAAEGRILCGGIAMLDPDPTNFRTLTAAWRAKRSPGGVAESTSLAYANGLIFFRGETKAEGRLYCYDLRKR